MEPWLFLGLALALGVKHAYDPDHLAAVGLLLARAPGARSAVRLGLHWGLGHALTAGLLTVALFLAKEQLATGWLAQMELVVAATLVLVGVLALVWEVKLIHRHAHTHGPVVHDHPHWHVLGHKVGAHHAMLGLGVLHGVASNDEMLLLLTASLGVVSLGGLLAGVGVFSLGVVAGMALFAALLALPVVRARSQAVRRAVNVATGLVSVGVGAGMLLG
ncbi:MAG TPA: hypothetical protein VGR28_06275 [Candidatus Thermoplasmatota archaeon]|nr:hypothetical protein [Candidatus Thermoplasmatota archaeon]